MESRNNSHKLVGAAINGLRPYIKALELQLGITKSANDFRYLVASDRSTACIVRNPNPGTDTPASEWVVVEGTEKPLSQWAEIGKRVRLAFIGLKSVKEDLRSQGDHVQFTLNLLTGEAFLSRDGERLSDRPQTIEEWAKIGRPVEKNHFDSYNAARDYNLEAAAAEVRAKMLRLGIIRERRQPATAN